MTEEELNLWRRCREGDEAAREELVLMHMGLVKFWAGRIHKRVSWVDHEDLMSAGTLGLWKAVNKFDYNRGLEFSTLARLYIRGEIFASPEITRDLSRRQYENYRKIRSAHDQMAERLGRKPTLDEIAEETGLTVEQVEDAINAWHIAFAAGFVDDEGDSHSNSEPDERSQAYPAVMRSQEGWDEPWEKVNDAIRIQYALLRLPETERLVLTLYYWEGKTDSEIARILGLTLGSARQIRIRALEKLRGMLE